MTGLNIWETICGRNEIASYSSLIIYVFIDYIEFFSLFGRFQR